MPLICRQCDRPYPPTWGGHCTGCHRSFSSDEAFDRHRKQFECLDPASLGMQVGARGYWLIPGGYSPQRGAPSRASLVPPSH